MAKLNINAFVAFLGECAARKDGYIMGTIGQDPKKLPAWYFDQYGGEQKKKALFWRDNCERVFDCQGMAEGHINDVTGSKVNVRARNNYATWCDPKGTGAIPNQYKVPGAAVFIHSASDGAITHVGFLTKPVAANKPAGDWYVVEARGVMYGVVTTKLNSRPWNRWGLMTKYFDYEASDAVLNLGDRILKKGMSGDDVKQMQSDLIALGYDLGKWGADGEFGPATEAALKAFQTAQRLPVDGIFSEDDLLALRALVPENGDPEEPAKPEEPVGDVVIAGGDAYIRTGPGTGYAKAGVAHEGERYVLAATDGWVPVAIGGEVRWISEKYAKGVKADA